MYSLEIFIVKAVMEVTHDESIKSLARKALRLIILIANKSNNSNIFR